MIKNDMNSQNLQQSHNESESSDVPPAAEKETPLPTNNRLNNFINENYSEASIEEWNDWKWQIKNSITKTDRLNAVLGNKKNDTIINMPENHLPFRITPYFAYLLSTLEDNHPLYRTIIPTINELNHTKNETEDPLDEVNMSPVPNIVHRYPDRALFLVTGFCSAYCRYCTRSHMVSKRTSITVSNSEWELGFDYIETHPEIRDVIVSGGDPLTLRDDQIEYILNRLRSIEHVEMIRIGTKIPVVNPMRITPELMNIIKKYHPVYMSIHFTHPDELTEETQKACNMIADTGIPMGSQSVLLKGINDNVETFRLLYRRLLKVRVKPYYLYSCDKIPGSQHFQSTIDKGLEIIDGLRGHTSGYACPQFVVDTSKGKISLLPNFVEYSYIDGNSKFYGFRNYEGKCHQHIEVLTQG
jgi:lysine 2,3-aminomutase